MFQRANCLQRLKLSVWALLPQSRGKVTAHCRLLGSGWYSAEEVTQQERGEIPDKETQGGGRRRLRLDIKLKTFSQSSQARSLSLVFGRKETSENSEPVRSPNMPTAAAWSARPLWDTSTVAVQTLRLWYKTIISIKTTRYSLTGIQLRCEVMRD